MLKALIMGLLLIISTSTADTKNNKQTTGAEIETEQNKLIETYMIFLANREIYKEHFHKQCLTLLANKKKFEKHFTAHELLIKNGINPLMCYIDIQERIKDKELTNKNEIIAFKELCKIYQTIHYRCIIDYLGFEDIEIYQNNTQEDVIK